MRVSEELISIIRTVLNRPELMLTPSSSARDVEGWDSLRNINIIVACEAHFALRFLPGELDELENVGAFVRLIEEKRNALRRA